MITPKQEAITKNLSALSWMFVVLSIYGFQDITHYQVLPNTPIIFLTLIFCISYKSNIIVGYTAFICYLAYYYTHFLLENYIYIFDRTTSTALIVVCTIIIIALIGSLKHKINQLEARLQSCTTANDLTHTKVIEEIERIESQLAPLQPQDKEYRL